MKYYYILFFISFLCGCINSDELLSHYDIGDYQGVWRDTLFFNDDIYVEDLIVSGNHFEFIQTNANTHIIHDKLSGTLVLGNENKIGWNCISSITNTTRQLNWNVLNLSTYQLKLFSKLQGVHDYNRVYSPFIEEYIVNDTLEEILGFRKYLPVSKTEMEQKFGKYNKMRSDIDHVYMINHPLFGTIRLKENNDNDSIYSYTLSIKNVLGYEKFINRQYTIFRKVNAITEYCDAEVFEKASHVITFEATKNQLAISSLKDYDYWPNVSHLLGLSLQEVKSEFGNKYVYIYSHPKDGLPQYDFQTSKDSICRAISIVLNTDGIVTRSAAFLLENYSEAQEKLILNILDRKYYYNRFENGTYYYYPSVPYEDVKFEIRYSPQQRAIMYFRK